MMIRTSLGDAVASMILGIALILLRKSIGNAMLAFLETFRNEMKIGFKFFKPVSQTWAHNFLMVLGIIFALVGGVGILQYLKR